jgi:formylglycine-generating enzyme required for sulfatase activity
MRKTKITGTLSLLLALAVTISAVPSLFGQDKEYTETIVAENGEQIQLKMVLIPGGRFKMGSPESEGERRENEGPQIEVILDPYYMASTETTLQLFMAYYREAKGPKEDFVTASKREDVDSVTGPTPVYGDMTMGRGNQNPAMGMTWLNAMAFCKWLSKKTGKTYRLPTEAEWEFAARGGGSGPFGEGIDSGQLSDYAWFKDNSYFETHDVAQKAPNAYGLYDILGNVREWVFDYYASDAYQQASPNNPLTNPTGPSEGKSHVVRGGDYRSTPSTLRVSYRSFEQRSWKAGDPQIPKSRWWYPNIDYVGFRVARSVE